MKVKVKLDKNGFEIEIDDNEQNQEYAVLILNKIDEILSNKKDLISTILLSDNETTFDSQELENKNSKKLNEISDQKPKIENKNQNSLSIDENTNENLAILARNFNIDALKLSRIYDFGSRKFNENEIEVPPLQMGVCSSEDTRVNVQREALLLLLVAQKILKNQDSLTSKSLTIILTESNLDSTDLSKVKSTEFMKKIRIDGRSYRILPFGELKAKELLREKTSNLD